MTATATLTLSTPTDREIETSREFDAPRGLVFDAHTRPELLRRWYGPYGWELVVCEVDLRVGGAWHYVTRHTSGAEMVQRGVFREVDPPARLVYTEANADCDAEDGAEVLVTTTLVEDAGRTTVRTTMRYPSAEVRDAVLASGMQRGIGEGYDRLAEAVEVAAIAARYRARADTFERTVAGVPAERWSDPSPCADWTARDVLGHVLDMHAAMLGPLGRQLTAAPADDPVGAFRAARADVEALLADPAVAGAEQDTPMGPTTTARHVDTVASEDLVVHRWDLARATGQDTTIDPAEVARMLPAAERIPPEFRIPGAFGPGVVVYGPEVPVPADAPAQDRLLGLLGRHPG